jgi:transposase
MSARPPSPDRHPLCAQDRHSLGRVAQGVELWLWHDLLASPQGLAPPWGLGGYPPRLPGTATGSRPLGLAVGGAGQRLGAGRFGGEETGANPTDRAKAGSKHHIITAAQGIPLAVKLTGANRHDITQALALVDAIPALKGQRGRPRRRPLQVLGDRGYDSEPLRRELRRRNILPWLGQRGQGHGSGLGVYRWVIERTLSWLHQFRRLRVRYERRADIHQAFLTLGCIIIGSRFLFR